MYGVDGQEGLKLKQQSGRDVTYHVYQLVFYEKDYCAIAATLFHEYAIVP